MTCPPVTGLGIDVDVLREAGTEGADAFLAVTNSDNSNLTASQIAKHLFGVPKVLARVYDPLLAQFYGELGIETVSATVLAAGLLFDRLFERPYRSVVEYLALTKQMCRIYAADSPMPEEVTARRASEKGQRPHYLIVAGGGKVGYQLTRTLLQEGYEVLLVEKRPQRYHTLREELGDAVFHGDACEIRTMVRIGMERADLVVAATGDDESNLIICQVAKRWFGVPRTIARVNNPRNEEVFRRLGIDETINATTLLFRLIKQEVTIGEILPLALMRKGGLEVVEMELTKTSPLVGKAVRDLSLPSGCLLAAVIRGNQAQVITGDTVLHAGDTVIVLATPQALEQLYRVAGHAG